MTPVVRGCVSNMGQWYNLESEGETECAREEGRARNGGPEFQKQKSEDEGLIA